MKSKMLRLMVFCMFTGLFAGFLSPAANAQEVTEPDPVLMIKIRNIEQLINDMEKLSPQTPGSKAGMQVAGLQMMLGGTDWIDSERSIVAGMVLEGQKASWAALIPFAKENPTFQQNLNAIAGDGYYMLPLPPQPGASVNPAIEQSLISASREPAAFNLVFEAAAGKLLDMLQPQMAAISKKIEAAPAEQLEQLEASGMTPQQIQTMIDSMVETARQVDILRFGLDLSGDLFTLIFDMEALPNTLLADVLTDQGGESRLTNLQFDMPLQFRSRAFNMSGMMELMQSSLGSFYSGLGIDFADMAEVSKGFTGEMVGGMSIGSGGIVMEMIGTLHPGIDGADYIQNTYMPFFERYTKQVSDLAAKETGKPGIPLYERTADSTVAGIKVMGVKTDLSSVIPPEEQENNPFANQAMEMRIAGMDDLVFIASNDARLEELIAKSRSLVRTPAQGPTIGYDIDLGALLKDIQSMLPPDKVTTPLPVDLGKVTMQADMKDGKLATRTSVNIAEIQKLVAAIATAASKAKTEAGGAAPNPNVN